MATSDPNWGDDPKAARKAQKAYTKAQRPFYKKKRYIIPAALVALAFAIPGGSDDGTDTVAAEPDAAPTAEAGAPAPAAAAPSAPPAEPEPETPSYVGATDDDTAVAAGQPIELSGWTTTATPLARTDGPFGGENLCTSVTLVNNDDKQQEYSALSWKLQGPSGSVIDSNYQGENQLSSAGLAAGGTVTKDVCFDDEGAGPGQYILSWQPDVFSSNKRGVWLNTL